MYVSATFLFRDNQASKKTPSSDGSCLSQNKMMTPKFLKKTGKPGWYNQLGNTMQKKVIPDSTCKIGTANPRWKTFPKLFKSVKRKAPKDTEPVSLLPPPDTMTRPGKHLHLLQTISHILRF